MESSSDSDDESSLLRIKPEVFTESVEASEKRSSALKERKRLEARAWGAGNHESRWSKSEAKMFHLLNGRAIVYQEQPKQQCLLWDCAIILARFLESRFAEKIRGKKVIEMGCGLGLPGMVAHELGASKVMLTEMASALKSLTAQLAANKYGTDISATALHWGTEDAARLRVAAGAFDYVLLSDCIYAGDSHNTLHLVESIKEISHESTVIISCHELRFETAGDGSHTQLSVFNKALQQNGWAKVDGVPIQSFIRDFTSEDKLFLHIYKTHLYQ